MRALKSEGRLASLRFLVFRKKGRRPQRRRSALRSLIVMRQPDPKRWDLSRLAQSPAVDEAVLAEQGLEGWAANLHAEDR